MDAFLNLLLGFKLLLQPMNILYCFIGVTLGTLIGVLPGIGPVATLSMLIPFTMRVDPLTSMIMLAGVYYGAMYGGSTTSILVNIPGEAASVVTCLDGYQMARNGRAGPALGMSAIGSFIGGTFGVIVLMILALPLARLAIRLGPPERFAIVAMGFTLVVYLGGRSPLKGAAMAALGLVLSCLGTDMVSGKIRFVSSVPLLYEGIDVGAMVMGLFGISEVLLNMEESSREREIFETSVKSLLPNLEDWKRSSLPIARGSIIGFLLGLIPGGGAILASFTSYAVEKRVSKHPEQFGKGAIEGVAGPETANNAAIAGAFVPLFSLGIPPNVIMAILMASLMLHGVAPGPQFISRNPDFFFGIVASMYMGNVMLLILNLPLIGIWVKILKIPYRILFPLILLFCVIGSYSLNNRAFDIAIMIAFGIMGYIMKKLDYPAAPLVFAFVLGNMFEYTFRQTMVMGGHDLLFFLKRPIALTALLISALLIASTLFGYFWKFRMRIANSGILGDD